MGSGMIEARLSAKAVRESRQWPRNRRLTRRLQADILSASGLWHIRQPITIENDRAPGRGRSRQLKSLTDLEARAANHVGDDCLAAVDQRRPIHAASALAVDVVCLGCYRYECAGRVEIADFRESAASIAINE